MSNVLKIAEIGLNHNGDFALAQTMVKMARDAGADVAKFQFYDPLKVLGADSPYLAYAKQCQFTQDQHGQLKSVCDAAGIEYLVSVFDPADVAFADTLCARHKVASRMCQDPDFRNALLKIGKPIIVSLGAPYGLVNNLGLEVWAAAQGIKRLYCVTEYPTPLAHFDFSQMMDCDGLSSHAPSIAPLVHAVSRKATVVEVHVTTDRALPGCDQSSSVLFSEFAQFAKIASDMEGFLWR